MRTSALLLLLLSLPAAAGRFDRVNSRTPQGRSTRGFLGTSLAQFEAFNLVSTGWCAGTAITGARGEALTGTRATAATCTKGVDGLRSTNIADGDLVSLGVNVMRAEADADGYLGLLVEGAASPITIQSRPVCNAAWADVGTPSCTADYATGPWGTETMALLTDNDAAAKEGRSQTMATTSATRFTAYCYVKGNTALEASLTLAGTGNAAGDCSATITALSDTSSSIISCTSAVAYTAAVTAVTVSVLVGDAVGDTGTIFVEGCNVVPSATYRTSFTDAAAVTVARGGELASFTFAAFTLTAPWSIAATVQLPGGLPTNARLHGSLGPTGLATYATDSYLSVGTWVADGTQVTPNSLVTAQTTLAGSTVRAATFHDGTLWGGCLDGTCSTAARAWTNLANVTTYRPGEYSATAGTIDGIQTRICFQNDSPSRCR